MSALNSRPNTPPTEDPRSNDGPTIRFQSLGDDMIAAEQPLPFSELPEFDPLVPTRSDRAQESSTEDLGSDGGSTPTAFEALQQLRNWRLQAQALTRPAQEPSTEDLGPDGDSTGPTLLEAIQELRDLRP